ncbi:unnamed protein product [Dovyalis caffra]|uniref:Uncharacterized protein n=1 Tax=Dovyalis caffra TaxID=77055 RepID=A0AAV1SSA9_9ROSI|nr:unnamed protein product [Dovyalis caffra]
MKVETIPFNLLREKLFGRFRVFSLRRDGNFPTHPIPNVIRSNWTGFRLSLHLTNPHKLTSMAPHKLTSASSSHPRLTPHNQLHSTPKHNPRSSCPRPFLSCACLRSSSSRVPSNLQPPRASQACANGPLPRHAS